MRGLVLALAMFATPFLMGADEAKPAEKTEVKKDEFNWRSVMGKSQADAVKALTDAGYHAVVATVDGKAQVTSKIRFDDGKPTVYLIIGSDKVVGAIRLREDK